MPNVFKRVWICCGLLVGLRTHDFRAAKTWLTTMYPGVGLARRLYRFACNSAKVGKDRTLIRLIQMNHLGQECFDPQQEAGRNRIIWNILFSHVCR